MNKPLHGPEWLEATKETRQACETALAELESSYPDEHKCLTPSLAASC